MAKLEINGRTVEVDDSFLKLSPPDQEKAVNEIAASFGASSSDAAPMQPAASMPVFDAMGAPTNMAPIAPTNPRAPQAELPPPRTSTADEFMRVPRAIDKAARVFAEGATMGTGDKIAAGVRSLLPGGDYDKGLAEERAYTKQAQDDLGPTGSTIAHGAGSIAGLVAAQGAGLPVFGMPGLGLFGRTATAAGTMGALGAGAGAIIADENKGSAALKEGAIQGFSGMAGPLIGAGVGVAARALNGVVNPQSAAVRRIMDALMESRRTPPEVATTMREAAAEGQPMFSVADAIGNPGARALVAGTKQAGPGRELAREALDQRQAGQARRLSDFMAEGFQAPETAAQATARLTARRAEEGAANYAAARQDAGAVDVTGALAAIDRTISPGASRAFSNTSNIADDSVESALRRARSLLAYEGPAAAPAGGAQPGGWGAYNRGAERVMDFQATHRAMLDIGDMADAAARAGRNNQARLLGEVRRELDTALTRASPSYASARDAYAAGSRQIEAVETGATAATRGRSEDVLRTFGALSPEEQAAFRHGYADRYIQGAQGGAAGSNAARPLTSDAVRTEFPAIAGGDRGERLMRQIDRENQMFATRQSALGGSSTAENLSDMKSGVSGIAELLMQGRPMAAGGALLGRAANAVAGMGTARAREELVRLLMSTDPATLGQIIGRAPRQTSEAIRAIARAAMQVGATGAADRALPGSAR